jgi:putative membrane protein
MSKNINRVVNLTSYFISLPPALNIVVAMVVLGLAFGFLINIGRSTAIHNAAIDGLMLLTLPALISALVVKLMLRSMPFRRIAATALCGEAVYSLAYGISMLLSGAGVNALWAQSVILIGAALVFVFWYVIARFVFILKYRSILFAMIQLMLYLIFLVSNQAMYNSSEPFLGVAARYFLSAFILLGALILFFMIINAPMKTNLGLSSTDAMSYIFGAWLYHNKEVEKAFDQVGEDARTLLSVMGFKRKSDTVFFTTPYVHFGPFGNLGGSEFSYLFAEAIDAKHKSKTFVFHGTVTHDLNPVASAELSKLMAAFDASVKGAVYKDAKVSLSLGRSAECRAEGLSINDSLMVGLTRAPETTEDINFGLGLALIAEAERRSVRAMVVDQHNAETGDITSFEPGSMVGFGYMEAIRDLVQKESAKEPLRLGVAFRSVDSDVLGKAGIKVAVFSSSPEYVVILIDSNGVTPRFRDSIEAEVKKMGSKKGRGFVVGIYTTDTHQTNMVRGVLNPLKEEENIMKAITTACKEAMDDMQEARFFSDKRWFDVRVIGAKQSIEVISTINSIVAVAKITLPLILIGGLLLLIAMATRV